MTKENTKRSNAQDMEILEKELLTLKVVREIIPGVKTKNGEPMYSYVLREKILVNGVEKEIKADFVAKDLGGYGVLELIFMLSDEAFLEIHDESMEDEHGNKSTYTVYDIWNEDDDGTVYKYQIKPFRASDKAKLSVILQKRSFKLHQLYSEQNDAIQTKEE